MVSPAVAVRPTPVDRPVLDKGIDIIYEKCPLQITQMYGLARISAHPPQGDTRTASSYQGRSMAATVHCPSTQTGLPDRPLQLHEDVTKLGILSNQALFLEVELRNHDAPILAREVMLSRHSCLVYLCDPSPPPEQTVRVTMAPHRSPSPSDRDDTRQPARHGVTGTSSSSGGYNFKVVLLGEGCVGKTSVILRYVEDKFNDKHITTLQASFLNKKINISGKRVNLSIWDTAGQERFHALGPIYYRMSNGAILVYDITDEDSFQKVKNWVKELKKMLGSDICLVIAGNKIDLEKHRTVSVQNAEEYAESVGAKHYHTSAKLDRGIEEMFLELSQRMIEQAQESDLQKASSLGRTSSMRRNVVVVDDEEESNIQTKSGCCGGGGTS
uniref:Ras-related protein Rab-21 n=1 Tax=Timema californicum TaxID=61474 RepID=A0A7R9P6B4_TIMCA|nr:unnamed protein product [Timema californicum]